MSSNETATTDADTHPLRQPHPIRPRLLRLNGDGHRNGYDHDCCGSMANWWLPPRLLRLNGGEVATTTATATTTTAAAQRRFGDYDHGNGYDHDCCGSTTAAITTLAMVTTAAAMATIAEPMGAFARPPPPAPPPLTR